MINKLNVMNYQVETFEGVSQYLTNGIRSIYNLCEKRGLDFRQVCECLYIHGQYVIDSESGLTITMI